MKEIIFAQYDLLDDEIINKKKKVFLSKNINTDDTTWDQVTTEINLQEVATAAHKRHFEMIEWDNGKINREEMTELYNIIEL